MSRSLFAVCLAVVVCATAPAANAQAARQHLPAIAGVPFGTSYAATQAQLGPGFKERTAPKQPDVRTLTGPAQINGQSFTVNFTFTPAGALHMVFAATSTPGGDDNACNAHWRAVRASLDAQFGPPDTQSDDPANSLAEAKFAFKDGSTIDASELGCLIGVIYETQPSGGKSGRK